MQFLLNVSTHQLPDYIHNSTILSFLLSKSLSVTAALEQFDEERRNGKKKKGRIVLGQKANVKETHNRERERMTKVIKSQEKKAQQNRNTYHSTATPQL